VQHYDPAKNYYKILEVDESAALDRIKTSYRTLVKKYHPDLNKGKEEQFKEVNEAYQVLSD
jgi:DnaJ-class molecular chaperone